MTQAPTSPVPNPDRIPAQAWRLLALMTSLNVLNFVDRQLISSLAPLLMEDLRLTRAHIGLLVGFSFVVFYTLVGLVLGVAADRWPRRWLVTGGVAMWSAMTAVSGAARGLVGLAGPRVLLGVGEATLTPAALAMLGDAFPPRRLGFATSVYYAGLPLGTALSLWIAGWVAPRFGWRTCFWMLGAVGLFMVVPMYFFREPPRRSRETAAMPTAATPTVATPVSIGGLVGDLLRALRDRPALGLVMLGGALLAYASAAALHGITWLVQERGFSFPQATILSGGMAIGSGCAGNLAGGWFTDWCQRRWAGGRSWSLVLLTVFFAPFSVSFFMLPPASPLFYACWFFSVASTVAYFGPTFAAIQELAPAHVRSSAVAMGLLVINVFGVGPGPWVTGLIGDRWSLTAGLVVSVGVALAAVLPFTLAARLTPPHRP